MAGALDSLEEREKDEPEPMQARAMARTILARADVPFTQQPFAAAIDAFAKRNIVPRATFDALSAAAKQKAFTVAGLATEELLGDAHAELDRQLKASPEHTFKDPATGKWVYKGPNLREFRKFTEQRLESAGWTPSNPSHVETIFRTNIASAYSTGRVAEMTQPAVLKLRPYWQIQGVRDDRQRPTHKAAFGVVLPADHPFWRIAFPPFGYNCRCRVISRSQKWVDANGGVSSPPTGLPDPGFASGTNQLIVSGDVLKEFSTQESSKVTPIERQARPVELPVSPTIPEPAWPKPPPLPKPKSPPKPKTAADIMQLQISGPKGSNPGGIYRGTDGKERYVKLYTDPAQAVGEHLANRLYADLGLGRVKSQLFEHQGKLAYASEIIEGATPIGQAGLTPELARKALDGLVGDLATANWDAFGLNIDNLVVTKSGKVVRIDNGGTFLSRAQGARKPEHLLDQLTEWDGFFSPSKNPAYSKLASIAGVKGPADLLPEIRKQLIRLELTASKAGGWLEYVTKAAPGADKATLERMAQMLEKRTGLIGQKIKDTEELVAEQKAAAKAAAAAQKAAEKAAKKIPKIPGTPEPPRFAPWRENPATIGEAVARLPGREIDSLIRSTRQPSTPEFRTKVANCVAAIEREPSCTNAIKHYTGAGSSEIRLAERVRSGNTFTGDVEEWRHLDDWDKRRALRAADALAEAHRRIASLPRPHEGHVLYRGIRVQDDVLTTMLSKKYVEFGGSGSTSFAMEVAAKRFAHINNASRSAWSVIYEIEAHRSGAAVDFMSSVKGEAEVLFPPGSRFEIVSVERITDYRRAILVKVRET
jgi:SPP1 gp7 family putative phage head morphogenesis protein